MVSTKNSTKRKFIVIDMIDQVLLAKLTAPDYGPALHGFSKHLDFPRESEIHYYGGTRPVIEWAAFNKYDPPLDVRSDKRQQLCRIKGCYKPTKGGQWQHCGSEHSKLFNKEISYYDWDMTRYAVYERDSFTCQLCNMKLRKEGREYGYLQYLDQPYQCDHIIPWAYVLVKFPDMPTVEKIHRFYLNRENLRTLCEACHRKVTAAFLRLRSARHRPAMMGEIQPLTDFLK